MIDPGASFDLGAGTGKLRRLLATRFDRVIAVEPLAEIAGYHTEPTYRATIETHVYWTRLAG